MADHAGVERPAVLANPLDVEGQRLLGVLGGVAEVFALRVQPREVGRVDVEAALLLGLKGKLDLPGFAHRSVKST